MKEYATAYEIWKFLNRKYNKTNEATIDKIMTRIQTFDYDPEKGIDGSWEKLMDFRRKLVSAGKTLKNLYPDRSLFLIFTRSLPSEYKATKDGLRFHKDMSVGNKLKELMESEEEVKEDEKEHAAFRKKPANIYLHIAVMLPEMTQWT
ncbi:hypothetical protein K3495_g2642 [Podosphaera aphanis]|nr:hypothetical protein K3495_g2642 [Podosphaera aphanis]